MTGTRNDIADIAKGIGIFLMVIGHCGIPQFLRIWIYSFHMPLFFFISGYFYTRNKYKATIFIKKRIRTLVVPYFLFLFIIFIWFKFMDCDLVPPNLNKLLTNGTDMAIWFIPVLLFTELAITIFNDVANRFNIGYLFYIMVITCIVLSYMAYRMDVHLPYKIEVVGMAMVYYLGGHLVNCIDVEFMNRRINLAFLFVNVSACIFFDHVIEMATNNWDSGITNIIIAFLGIAGMFSVAKAVKSLTYIRPYIVMLGEYSIIVLGLSQPYYVTIKKMFVSFPIPDLVSFVIRQVVLWIILTITIIAVKRYIPWIIGKGRQDI